MFKVKVTCSVDGRKEGVCPFIHKPNERDSFCLNIDQRSLITVCELGLYVFCDFLQKPTIASATPFSSSDRGKTHTYDETTTTVVYTYGVTANGYCCDDCRAPAREKW